MNKTIAFIVAIVCLVAVFTIATWSIKDDALTMDEQAHLPAGYSYLSQKDMRLNPEHPPLVKDLSAIPLMFFKDIKFPKEITAWKDEVNSQWSFGNNFLFKSGNPANKMIFAARIPMILLMILAGFFIFRWTRELYGNWAGIIAVAMFSMSPTFLAHGRLVTTDVGAALGAVMAIYYFVKYIKNNTWLNLVKAGIFFGIAELLKFSLILLIPFFGVMALVWVIVKSHDKKQFVDNLLKYFGGLILFGLIGLALIWMVYIYHVWNYPPEKQKADTEFILSSFNMKGLTAVVVWMTDKPILRGLAQYLLGLFMIFQRASGGNTGYFMGEVSAAGWKLYFPVVYLIKETITFHILTLVALFYFLFSFKRESVKTWIEKHFAQITAFLFVALYWGTSLKSNLNIGVRHLLPVFPFTIILVAGAVYLFIKNGKYQKVKLCVLLLLFAFQAYSVFHVFPNFLSYFNEAVGGPANGYKYVVDSNLDWGQDLRRLNTWLVQNNVKRVYLEYFGGGDTYYYLGSRYMHWNGTDSPNKLPKPNYLAVSATLLQGGRGKPAKGFDQPNGFYNWLNDYKPVAVIGNSIFVYKIDK